MEYLIRLVQVHELFRRPEIKALAEVAGIKIEIISYSADVRMPYLCRSAVMFFSRLP